MKRWISVIHWIGWGLGFAAVVSVCRGELDFEKRVWKETADVSQERVAFAFPFRNAGDREITITAIKSSCGCTTAKLEKKTYAPGESGEITGKFTIGSRQGAQRKTIRLTTDSVAQPQVLLTVEVDIPKLLTIRPGMVLWRKGGEPEIKTIRLEPNGDLGIEIADVSLESDVFSLVPAETGEDGEESGASPDEVLVAVHSTDDPARALIRIKARLPDGREKQYFAHALVR